jgi:hypothetical protein
LYGQSRMTETRQRLELTSTGRSKRRESVACGLLILGGSADVLRARIRAFRDARVRAQAGVVIPNQNDARVSAYSPTIQSKKEKETKKKEETHKVHPAAVAAVLAQVSAQAGRGPSAATAKPMVSPRRTMSALRGAK